jgi:hypothetical protein
LSSSNGSAPRSPCIVHHNKPLVPAPRFRVVVGLPAITMKDLLTWYEYVGVWSDNTIPCSYVTITCHDIAKFLFLFLFQIEYTSHQVHYPWLNVSFVDANVSTK